MYNNLNYWTDLHETKHPSTFKKHHKKLNDVIKNNSDNLKLKIINQINEKGVRITCLYMGAT